jgi:putative endonuclease
MSFYVYMLRTSGNTLYTGQTNDLKKRLNEHKTKSRKSSKYVRSFPSAELVYSEKHLTRSSAMKREAELKRLTKKEKELLIGNPQSMV